MTPIDICAWGFWGCCFLITYLFGYAIGKKDGLNTVRELIDAIGQTLPELPPETPSPHQ
jgi:hypothetical protein